MHSQRQHQWRKQSRGRVLSSTSTVVAQISYLRNGVMMRELISNPLRLTAAQRQQLCLHSFCFAFGCPSFNVLCTHENPLTAFDVDAPVGKLRKNSHPENAFRLFTRHFFFFLLPHRQNRLMSLGNAVLSTFTQS